MEHIRDELIQVINEAQAELDDSLRAGEMTLRTGRSRKLMNQIARRADEVRSFIERDSEFPQPGDSTVSDQYK